MAPNIATQLVGWWVCHVCFNATLDGQAAVPPDQVPANNAGWCFAWANLSRCFFVMSAADIYAVASAPSRSASIAA